MWHGAGQARTASKLCLFVFANNTRKLPGPWLQLPRAGDNESLLDNPTGRWSGGPVHGWAAQLIQRFKSAQGNITRRSVPGRVAVNVAAG